MIYNSQYQLNGAQLGKWKIKKALKKTFKAVKKTTGKVATAATSVAMRAYGVAPQQQQASSAESYPQASQSSGNAPMVSYGAPGATQQSQSSGSFLDDVMNEMYPQDKPAKVSSGAPAAKKTTTTTPTGKQSGNSNMLPILALAGVAAFFMMKGKKK